MIYTKLFSWIEADGINDVQLDKKINDFFINMLGRQIELIDIKYSTQKSNNGVIHYALIIIKTIFTDDKVESLINNNG